MPAQKKIAILLHERDTYPEAERHFIWTFCNLWRERGIEVDVLKGVEEYREADLLFPHIDATVVPLDYLKFYDKYQRVLNHEIHDISKRAISRNLLNASDDYSGPVIVKTNLNCGGFPDLNFPGEKVTFQKKQGSLRELWRRLKKGKRPGWAEVNCIRPSKYKIFPSLKEVPREVFANKLLVVEKFLAEYENGTYYVRVYKFLGGKSYCARLGSTDPIVKSRTITSREETPIPPEVAAYRRNLKMDYGKIDFVIHQGHVEVFDVNSTPGLLNDKESMKANALVLADGINDFLD